MALAEIVRRAEEAADAARKKYSVEIPVVNNPPLNGYAV